MVNCHTTIIRDDWFLSFEYDHLSPQNANSLLNGSTDKAARLSYWLISSYICYVFEVKQFNDSYIQI